MYIQSVPVNTMFKNVELRKLPAGPLYGIVEILETNNDWKRVMCLIPKNPETEQFVPKYNNEHIRLIEDSSKSSGRKCAEILLDEWSTSGKIRPTLETLKELVIKAQIYRAADEIATILQETLPLRPQDGPAAPIDIDISTLLENDATSQDIPTNNSIRKYFENTTQQLYKKTDDLDKIIGNQTTAQMKSASDLIKFSSNMDSADIPNISALQSVSNKTTTQMKSESNLIKFSAKHPVPQIQMEESSQESVNIPDFSALMTKSEKDHENVIMTYTESSVSHISEYTRAESQETSEIDQKSNMFQMSLPNIEFENTDSAHGIDSLILQDSNLIQFNYKDLDEITSHFSPDLIKSPTGLSGRIGSGGFGEVFVGFHQKYGPLAVKKAHSNLPIDRNIAMKFFNAEVKYLSQFRHKNIVPILGFSKNGPSMCIVCEYIEEGSLEQKLAEKVLTEKQRIKVMIGTAEGLKYLHKSGIDGDNDISRNSVSDSNSKKNNFLHGDVKSANILLTRDCVPKLCDFGLAKQFETTFVVTSPMGTSAYMAPEGFSGTITQKIDIYSYGIVLLELLTGLKAIITNECETINIKLFIEENCVDGDITTLLDPVVDNWTKAKEVYDVALKCLKKHRKLRPTIDEVCDILYKTVD